MSDITRRFPENPLLRPAEIRPSVPGMNVECLLNPGAFRFDDKIWLLLRVAERPEQQSGSITVPMLKPNGTLEILQIAQSDPKLDSSDLRVLCYDGVDYIIRLSHLR